MSGLEKALAKKRGSQITNNQLTNNKTRGVKFFLIVECLFYQDKRYAEERNIMSLKSCPSTILFLAIHFFTDEKMNQKNRRLMKFLLRSRLLR